MEDLPGDLDWHEKLLALLLMSGIHNCRIESRPDAAAEHVWAHDENYTIVYCNQTFREIYCPDSNSTCYQLLYQRESVCHCCKSMRKIDETLPAGRRCAICRRGPKGMDVNISHVCHNMDDGGSLYIKSSTFVGRENTGDN